MTVASADMEYKASSPFSQQAGHIRHVMPGFGSLRIHWAQVPIEIQQVSPIAIAAPILFRML